MLRLPILLLIFSFTVIKSENSPESTQQKITIGDAWNKLWSSSCALFPLVSRTRRSVQFPDRENSAEFFNWLYPHANMKRDEYNSRFGRSLESSSMLWNVADSAIDIWKYECQHKYEQEEEEDEIQRVKRSTMKKQRNGRNQRTQSMFGNRTMRSTRKTGMEEDILTWANYLAGLKSEENTTLTDEADEKDSQDSYFLSYLEQALFPRTEESQFKVDKQGYADTEEEVYVDEDENGDEDENNEEEEYVEETKMDEVKDDTKSTNGTDTTTDPTNGTTTTEAPTEAPTEATTTAAPGAQFFNSYGGDVEYFVPIMSFTIPFDGDITILGFHGFKGVFPY